MGYEILRFGPRYGGMYAFGLGFDGVIIQTTIIFCFLSHTQDKILETNGFRYIIYIHLF